jgi:hypothetical protein
MKHKKLFAVLLAATTLTALTPVTAFASETGTPTTITQASDSKTGDLTVAYEVQAMYTVTIPASVTLRSDAQQTAQISASNVLLAEGQTIQVELETASNTESGSIFHAKTASGNSTATYNITNGEGGLISVGDTIASFGNGGGAPVTLTFSEAQGESYAGEHTETLTFKISTTGGSASHTLSIPMKAIDDAEAASSAAGGMVLKDIAPLEFKYHDKKKWSDICTSTSGDDWLDAVMAGDTATYGAGWYYIMGSVAYWNGKSGLDNVFVLFKNGTASMENLVALNSDISDSENYLLVPLICFVE